MKHIMITIKAVLLCCGVFLLAACSLKDIRGYSGPEAWDYYMVFHHPNGKLQIQSVLSSELEGPLMWKRLKIGKPAAAFLQFENFGKMGEVKDEGTIGSIQSDYIHLIKNHIYMEMGKEYDDFHGNKLKATGNGIRIYNGEYQYVIRNMPRLNSRINERFAIPPSIAPLKESKNGFEVFYWSLDDASWPFHFRELYNPKK